MATSRVRRDRPLASLDRRKRLGAAMLPSPPVDMPRNKWVRDSTFAPRDNGVPVDLEFSRESFDAPPAFRHLMPDIW